MPHILFDLNNVDFLSGLGYFNINTDNLAKINDAYGLFQGICDRFHEKITRGCRVREVINPLLSFIYSCHYTDTKHKESISRIEELEIDIKKKSDQLEQVEAMVLYLSRQIDELKEHNKCLSARLYELEK